MALSVYAASVPVFTRGLNTLHTLLDKVSAHCEAKKIKPAAFYSARLFPDMIPFSGQVQIATDHAKGASARLAGVEIPKFADEETDFMELKTRVDNTLSFIAGLSESAFEGGEDRVVTLTMAGHERRMRGDVYLLHYAVPNFLFHVTTAYDILRHNGVEIGKRDFIGPISFVT
jgi:hypothetical protein